MSLLSVNYEAFTILDPITVDDSYGGYQETYVPGATIQAAAVKDESVEALVAGVQGVTAVYTIITGKNVNLRNYMVLKRKKDGKIFRVRSDGEDKETPKGAGLNMRQVRAEEWVIPG